MTPKSSPPFTRLHVPDPAVNHVLQDLYDKLNQVAQSQALQNTGAGGSPAPPPAPPAANLRQITKSATLRPDDHTINAVIQQGTSVLLPHSQSLAGRGPFIVRNDSGSAANLSLGSARGELVDGVAATTYSLAPGQSLTLQPNPGFWVIVNQR